MYKGAIQLSPLGGGYWWHIHEMTFGFTSEKNDRPNRCLILLLRDAWQEYYNLRGFILIELDAL